jgi:cytochrome c2
MRATSALVAVAVAVMAAAVPAAAQDVATGKTQFKTACAVCHSEVAGKNGVGPSLAGIVGSTSGTVPGFNFSPAMKNAKIKWDAKALDQYLTNPGKKIPQNRMPYPGQPDAAKRAAIIAYLATLK